MAKRLFFYAVLIVIITAACTKAKKDGMPLPAVGGISAVNCDVELLSEDGGNILSNDSSIRMNSSYQRSDSIARSDMYSLKLMSELPYGFTIDIANVNKNEIIRAGFWYYGFKPSIVFCDSGNVFYQVFDKVLETDSAGWKRIGFSFRAPGNLHNNALRIYAWNSQEETSYVDDFYFERKPAVARNIAPDMLLRIKVDDSDMDKLKKKRQEALSYGILESDDDDYVKMKLIYMEDTLKGSMRLKGDWLDHLQGDKWSYRIKLKSKYSWKGMKTFSLQTPKSRSFIDEWLSHLLFDKEDILTTRYGFINVEVNGQDMGVYAYEEHFDKHLIEYNNRKEGPIVKFNEDAFWLSNKLNLNSDKRIAIPTYNESDILPFKENRTAKSPELLQQFMVAQNLMMMYREWNSTIQVMFDIDKLARYMALLDITKGYHALPWHNQRYYFNPVLCTLEPVAFDCYTANGVFDYGRNTIIGDLDNPEEFVRNKYNPAYQFFLDNDFRRLYIQYLNKYADIHYIRNFLSENEDDILKTEALIQEEFIDYQYNDSFLLKNVMTVKEIIKVKKDQLSDDKLFKNLKIKTKHTDYDTILSPEIPPYYVKAYLQKKPDSVHNLVRVVNNCPMDIRVIGYIDKDNNKYFFPQEYRVNSINRKANTLEIKAPVMSSQLLYTVPLFSDIFQVNVFPWKYPESYSPRIDLFNKAQQSFLERYASGNKIIIPAGQYDFNEPVIIPEGYECNIMAGVDMNFTNRSFFLSYSPVKLQGEAGQNIIIRSENGTSMGFIVLQAKDTSVLSHVVFDGLSSMNYNGWYLTGGVTFYESDVEMDHVSFMNNRSEDALNIIRSSFKIENCVFDNIFSDAFDSDFSEGTIEFSNFYDIKNDAIDFSGSHILIRNCTIKNTGDKAISSGERSRLVIENVDIVNANIGVASKDNSTLEIKNSSITDARYGFTAFNKKSEYKGIAVIKSEAVKMKNISVPAFIEHGSLWTGDGTTQKGTEKDVADLFY
ncbi:MAG: CotH kinase family protein [Bacteroidales bacterium]|nr:CotH kinase family protein [Bacteroidales bacterium]